MTLLVEPLKRLCLGSVCIVVDPVAVRWMEKGTAGRNAGNTTFCVFFALSVHVPYTAP